MASYLEQFNYQIVGPADGPRWVFLHGLMGYGLNWRRIVSGLQDTQRILTYDQRGHGKSFKPLAGYAPEDYAEDLFLITEELGWQKFILVGHSMGGRNALMFAHKFPEKVEKLVIEDIGPEGDPGAPQYYQRLFDLIPTPFPSKLAAKEFFMNEFVATARSLGQPETLGGYLYANLIQFENGLVDWRFSKDAMLATVLQGRAKDHWHELRALPMETLIIRGTESKELSHEVFIRMINANPRIHGVEIPNAAHWVHSDQPEAFLAALKKLVGL